MNCGRRFSALFCAVLVLTSCDRAASGIPASNAPAGEWLIAAGDSTWWVASGRDGISVRSAPVVLTRDGTTLYEITVVEDITDYEDAEFIAERLVAREVAGRDTVVLFADNAVREARSAWATAHPGDAPIDLSEEEAPEPESSASELVEVVDVHGPWVSWAHALDIDIVDVPGHVHTRARGVSHVATGARAAVRDLFDGAEALRVEQDGRQRFNALLAGVRSANDPRAERAKASLTTFAFNAFGFSLRDSARVPAVLFHLAGTGTEGEALELEVPPVVVRDQPSWWRDVLPTLGVWSNDSTTVEWRDGTLRIVGVADSARRFIALSLLDTDAPANSRGGEQWPLLTVPLPAFQVISLRAPALSAAQRASLEALFSDARGDDLLASRTVPRRPQSIRPTAAAAPPCHPARPAYSGRWPVLPVAAAACRANTARKGG